MALQAAAHIELTTIHTLINQAELLIQVRQGWPVFAGHQILDI